MSVSRGVSLVDERGLWLRVRAAHRSIVQSASLIDEIEILDLTPMTCPGVIVTSSIGFALTMTVDLSSHQ
jgi:hypothetical protein